MQYTYKIADNDALYFTTITIRGWVDLFTRRWYKDCIVDSLDYCIANKGLQVHAFVIMSNHIHLIISSNSDYELVDTIRDFKKFTSKAFLELMKDPRESRGVWLLNKFKFEAGRTTRGENYLVWKEGYHAVELFSNKFIEQKLNYIHNNPVKAGLVDYPEDYIYSSARDYVGNPGLLPLMLLDYRGITNAQENPSA